MMRTAWTAMVAAVALAGCQQAPELKAEKAWVRLPAVAGHPGAAYFTIHGGPRPDTLVAVSTPAALRAELHESMKRSEANGAPMMTMQPIRDIGVPTGGTVVFAPGGKHVMLYDLGPAVKAGGTMPLTLSFASGRKLDVAAKVVGAADPAP